MKIIETVTPTASTTHHVLNGRMIYPMEVYYQDANYEGLVRKIKEAVRTAWSAYVPSPDSTELTILIQWRLTPTKQHVHSNVLGEEIVGEIWAAWVAISALGIADGDDFKYPTNGEHISIITDLD